MRLRLSSRLLQPLPTEVYECGSGDPRDDRRLWKQTSKENPGHPKRRRTRGRHLQSAFSTLAGPTPLNPFYNQEHPLVATLDADLEGKGTHCSHCLRTIQSDIAIRPESDRLASAYCSKDCQLKAHTQSQGLLFTADPPVPDALLGAGAAPANTAARADAQAAWATHLAGVGRSAPLLVARLIARQVANETLKMLPSASTPKLPGGDAPEADGGDYTLYDHLERIRFLEVNPPKAEMELLRNVLQTALPGLEEFVTDERHATLLGKMMYNAYGVCFGGGRDDKVCVKILHEQNTV